MILSATDLQQRCAFDILQKTPIYFSISRSKCSSAVIMKMFLFTLPKSDKFWTSRSLFEEIKSKRKILDKI